MEMVIKVTKDIDKNMKESINTSEDVKWFDLNNKYLRGLAFNNGFSRLNTSISKNVDYLQRHPSGVNINFQTNAKVIKIKAIVDNSSYMSHMTAIGQIDRSCLFNNNKFVFISTTKTT